MKCNPCCQGVLKCNPCSQGVVKCNPCSRGEVKCNPCGEGVVKCNPCCQGEVTCNPCGQWVIKCNLVVKARTSCLQMARHAVRRPGGGDARWSWLTPETGTGTHSAPPRAARAAQTRTVTERNRPTHTDSFLPTQTGHLYLTVQNDRPWQTEPFRQTEPLPGTKRLSRRKPESLE